MHGHKASDMTGHAAVSNARREPPLEAFMKRGVVAVDLSGSSLRAVDLAADLAAKYDAELVLLTVGHVIVGPDPGMEA